MCARRVCVRVFVSVWGCYTVFQQKKKGRIITVYSFVFYSHAITCSFDTPSQKYAILSLSWLYAVTGIICTATFLFLKFEFTM